jgi:uncharacterized pyridoxal phosphate-dependent enzyme
MRKWDLYTSIGWRSASLRSRGAMRARIRKMNIYQQLGVRPFVNAYRPLTRLGGSRLPEPVVEAMRQASGSNIMLRTMQEKVGEAIAILTNNDAAYVSCGAASGIALAVAACIAGTDPVLADLLPNTVDMKNQVLMHTCDRGLKSDVAIRCAGGKIVNFGTNDVVTELDLVSAITRRTAAIFAHDLRHPAKLNLEQIVKIGREHQIPVLVDAAFSVPPKRTFWTFTKEAGADAVFISGGKGLRGPQSTGLVLGKTWLVNGCAFHGPPNDRIGRGMKVGKEELAGIYAAVKLFMERDERSDHDREERLLKHILESIETLPSVSCQELTSTKALISFSAQSSGLTPRAASRRLLESDPSVYLEPSQDGLIVSTECLEDGEEKIVANQLRILFRQDL